MSIIKKIFFVLWAIICEIFNIAAGLAIITCKAMLFALVLGIAAGYDGIE